MLEETLAMAWLADGIPLSLLMDLADPFGLNSEEIYRVENCDLTWLERRAA